MDLRMPVRPGRGGARARFLALGGVVAVLIAGCGGSSTPTTTTTKKPAAHKTTAPKPTTSTAAATSSGGGSTASTVSTSSSSASPSFASAGNCLQLAGVGQQFAKAMAAATSGGKFDLSAAVAAYKHLADAAPSAIRPDVETLANAFTSYATALQKAGYTVGSVPSPTQIAEIEKAAHTFSESGLVTAAKAVEAWAAKNCSAG